ncbi:hypothetical protein VNO77_39255 [Canavalia gladiata]|uniref:Uncharacterized protein n=1 Tax=Canavalia gladiata TaxID=3824 RepID=A0AAN9KDC6_CANGL
MPGWVAPTCDLSRGTKVMEQFYDLVWVYWVLHQRVLREAGFTEQRIPLAPNSGGITGCCNHSPQWPIKPSLLEPSLFVTTVHNGLGSLDSSIRTF